MVSLSVTPIDKDLNVFFNAGLSPDKRSGLLAQFALEQFKIADDINASIGGPDPHQVFVDGSAGASEFSVRPDGVITYVWDLTNEVLSWIGEQLVQHSPVGPTGRYAGSHVLYADGVEIEPGDPLEAKEYVFLNTQPYARKIELPRAQSTGFPSGVYQAVAALARAKFGKTAKIGFTFHAALNAGALETWANNTTLSSKGHASSPAKRAEWLRRQPAIVVVPR